MFIELIIILVLFILILIYFYIVEPRMIKEKVNNNNQYGSARFATTKEIKRNFNKEKINNIKCAGVPILFNRRLTKVWFDRITPHYVYLGSTGSGKSVTAVIPLCTFISNSKNKRSVFITDPKGEIFGYTSNMFKLNNYEIITIDFRNPEYSNKINILEPIIKEYEKYIEYEEKSLNEKDELKSLEYCNKSNTCLAETNRLISSLSSMIMLDKNNEKDPFWNNSSKNLLEGIIGLFLEEYILGNIKRKMITMTSVRKFQNSIMINNNLEKLRNYIDKKEYGLKSKDSLTPVLSASENTLKSIFAVAGEKLSIFDDINVSNVTSSCDFEFDVLGTKPTAIYLIVPDEDKTYYSLVSIIVGLLYKCLVKSANENENKKLDYEIDWILDEFANCPPLTDIESIVSVARSRGMRFHFFIQSFSQLNNVYGDDVSQIILDNCGLIYLKTNTEDTADTISKMLGKRTIESNSVSNSINNSNGNKTHTLIARDLMTPEEIKLLHYKTIIFPTMGYPILRSTYMYNKFKCYKKGFVKRKTNPILNLSDTYFTVENIKNDYKDNKNEEVVDNAIEAQQESDKEILKIAVNKIKSILKNYTLKVIYEEVNGRMFAKIRIQTIKFNKFKDEIIKELSNYHLEINSINDKMTQLEVHIKGFNNFNLDIGDKNIA